MYNSQPFRMKCHADCESCLFGSWETHCSREFLSRHSPLTTQKHVESAATVIACGSVVDGWNLLAVDVCSSQPPSLRAMNATVSMTEKQLEEGEADTVQLL